MKKYPINKTEEQWKEELTDFQYYVLRQAGTERPFTGELLNNTKQGSYHCAACDEKLFYSESKFDSSCGWPSFDKRVSKDAIEEKLDKSHGMLRTEIVCSGCGSHLGHLFTDGPTETGMRYCVNSVSLVFKDK
jgi:peptide-methionine (R)-S-oxide reductase